MYQITATESRVEICVIHVRQLQGNVLQVHVETRGFQVNDGKQRTALRKETAPFASSWCHSAVIFMEALLPSVCAEARGVNYNHLGKLLNLS